MSVNKAIYYLKIRRLISVKFSIRTARVKAYAVLAMLKKFGNVPVLDRAAEAHGVATHLKLDKLKRKRA